MIINKTEFEKCLNQVNEDVFLNFRVLLKDVLNSKEYMQTKAKLPVLFGKTYDGQNIIEDFTSAGNIISIGSCGSGDMSFMIDMILGLLNANTNSKLCLLDFTGTELNFFENSSNLYFNKIWQREDCLSGLETLKNEITERLTKLKESGAKTFEQYKENQKTKDVIPYIVAVLSLPYLYLNDEISATNEILRFILNNANKCGVYVYLRCRSSNKYGPEKEMFDKFKTCVIFNSNVDDKLLKLELLPSKLYCFGDCIASIGGGSLTRLKVPFILDDEIRNLVK